MFVLYGMKAQRNKRLSESEKEKEKEKETKGTQQIIQQRKHMRYERSTSTEKCHTLLDCYFLRTCSRLNGFLIVDYIIIKTRIIISDRKGTKAKEQQPQFMLDASERVRAHTHRAHREH